MRDTMRRAVVGAALALAIGSVGGCNFIESPTGDPNAVPNAQLDQLFTTAQVNWFFMNESELGRMPAIWLQQMRGVERQFGGYEVYIFGEDIGDDTWQYIYRHGGLLELKEAEQLAAEAGRPAYVGILEVYEAYLMGTAADVWGDVPYTQAADPEVSDPALDGQMSIYDAVQSLLDKAITDLGGEGAPLGAVDMVFGGDTDAWIAVAHTLKARYYMHTAEVNGDAAYQAALAEAQQGITDVSGNWTTIHSSASTEANDWWQFTARDRTGYIGPNPNFEALLEGRGDPRVALYYADTDGNGSADNLNIPGEPDYNLPMVTCSENEFIIAEAQFHLGNAGAAQTAYDAALQCQEDYWASLGHNISLTSRPVSLQEIVTAKYISLFLNPEVWNDYKRTCYPQVVPPAGATELAGHTQVPPGFYYPQSERQTNPSLPANDDAVLRNANDPNYCTYPGVN